MTVVAGLTSLEIETPSTQPQTSNRRRVPKSLIVLFAAGILAFGALVVLIRMPKDPNHGNKEIAQSLPLTLRSELIDDGSDRKNSKGPLREPICRSSACLKTAYSVLDSMNNSVNPCTDFYEFACGGWIAKNPIPPEVSKWSHFGILDKSTNTLLQEILKEPSRANDPKAFKQAKDFYKACSNVDELDRVGLEPIVKMLEEYGGWPLLADPGRWNPSKFDWMKSMADLKRRFGTSVIMDIIVNQHVTNPLFNTIHLQQPSLFMSRPYLLEQGKYPKYINAYKELIVDLAKELKNSPSLANRNNLIGNPSKTINVNYLREKADEVIQFEALLANLSRDGVTVQYGLRNSTSTVTLNYLNSIFNNYTYANATNKFEIRKMFEYTFRTAGVKIKNDQLISMADTNYIGGMFEILAATPPETLANYEVFRMLAWIVSGTTKNMRSHIAKYHRAVYGLTNASSRNYVCASSAEEKFGIALSRPYLQKANIDESAITQALEIMEQVRSSFISLLDGTRWMNESVKGYLKRKAKGITPCFGYASWMPTPKDNKTDIYSQQLQIHFRGLEFGTGTGNYIEKLWNVRTWLSDQKLKLLSERFQPGCKWTSFPGQIGAFYDIRRQAVNIPVGLLQPPFFNNGSPSAFTYGGLGSILGHEFTHGFTVSGWTEEERGSFTPLAQCFVDHYRNFRVPETGTLNINGALTFDENFPDNGGLLEAYQTLKNFSPRVEQTLPGLEKFSQDQLFFLGFANIWCSSSRREGLVDQVLQDHHTPNRYRVIGTLQNSQEFANAWKCPLGSPMNPQNHKKCTVF